MLTVVVNHLWQSTMVAAAIAALAAMLRDDGAHSRYWRWWAASVKFLVPFSLLTALGSGLGAAGAPRVDFADWPATLGVLAEPMPMPVAAGGARLAVALLVIWALGFAAVVGAWLARALKVRALLRASTPYAGTLPRGAAGLEARTSHALLEPALVGIVRPVLLLPRGIAEHLTRARLVAERERACDEAVVRAGHDGRTYAEGILNVCERYVASALKCAAGISGSDLKSRVVEIARNRVMSVLPIQKKILLGAFALGTLLVPIIFGAAAQDGGSPVQWVRIQPNYPPEALAAGREGLVELEFTIAATARSRTS